MQQISFVSLILNASLVVQLVMAGLALLSVISWALIFQKVVLLRAAKRDTVEFERTFWSGSDLNTLYDEANRNVDMKGTGRLFRAGFAEFQKLRGRSAGELSDVMEGTRRAMRAAAQRELEVLDSHNDFLATVGSVSPYIGLFGTVWGIMHAFGSIAAMHNTNLSVVAPGISEALFATAIGLVTAIPAVIAYNVIGNSLGVFEDRLDAFGTEFAAILSRQSEERG